MKFFKIIYDLRPFSWKWNFTFVPNDFLFTFYNKEQSWCEIMIKTSFFLEKYYFLNHISLTLSWRKPISYRNQSIDLLRKSVDWFLYDIGLRHERVTEKELGSEEWMTEAEINLENDFKIKKFQSKETDNKNQRLMKLDNMQ